MERIFEPILDSDEKVIKAFKPHKGKMFTSMMLAWIFSWIWILFVAFLGICTDYEGNFEPSELWIALLVVGGILIVLLGITILFVSLVYKNTYYAYTNKRVIIRKGIFGVDYKSLDLGMIGAVEVNVSLLDKIVHKNTGSIGFGSMASPMGAANATMFKFAHIQNPYETYKEIKSVVDEFKNKKDSK